MATRFSGPAAATGIFFSGSLSNSISGFEFKNNQVQHLGNMASSISSGTLSGNTFNVVSPGNYSLVHRPPQLNGIQQHL